MELIKRAPNNISSINQFSDNVVRSIRAQKNTRWENWLVINLNHHIEFVASFLMEINCIIPYKNLIVGGESECPDLTNGEKILPGIKYVHYSCANMLWMGNSVIGLVVGAQSTTDRQTRCGGADTIHRGAGGDVKRL